MRRRTALAMLASVLLLLPMFVYGLFSGFPQHPPTSPATVNAQTTEGLSQCLGFRDTVVVDGLNGADIAKCLAHTVEYVCCKASGDSVYVYCIGRPFVDVNFQRYQDFAGNYYSDENFVFLERNALFDIALFAKGGYAGATGRQVKCATYYVGDSSNNSTYVDFRAFSPSLVGPEETPPSVAITNPSDGASYSGSTSLVETKCHFVLRVLADVNDASGITWISGDVNSSLAEGTCQLDYLEGNTTGSANITCDVDVPAGAANIPADITVFAYDVYGNYGTDRITVYFTCEQGGIQPPP